MVIKMKVRKTRQFSKIYQNNSIYKNVANIIVLIVYCIVCTVINKVNFFEKTSLKLRAT